MLAFLPLTLLFAFAPASAFAEGFSSSLNAGVKRALVNPQTSYNFESTIDESCRIMCKGLVAISKECKGEATCSQKALCTDSGLNSLVNCESCSLLLSNKTTGVTEEMYANATSIFAATNEACTAALFKATPNATLPAFSEYHPFTNTAKTDSSGVGSASNTTSSASSSPGSTSGAASVASRVSNTLALLVVGAGAAALIL